MTNLSKQAMLVSVNIINGGLLGERKNREASELVQNTYHVSDKRAKATTYLIDRNHKAVKRVISASQAVRQVIYYYTMPWGNDKMRLLPVALDRKFKTKLSHALSDLEQARADYVRAYPQLVQDSKGPGQLGELFNPEDYPHVDRIPALFTTRIAYWPMPESGHFIADISNEAAKEAKAKMESEIEERLIEGTYDMVDRARKVIGAFIDKLEKVDCTDEMRHDNPYDRKYELSGMIRDSLLDNIDETSHLIEKMNLTENAQIKKVVTDLRRLNKFSAERWRRIPRVYQEQKPEALETAREIMANLEMLNLRDKEIETMVADASEYM